jgi:hypothetical protein
MREDALTASAIDQPGVLGFVSSLTFSRTLTSSGHRSTFPPVEASAPAARLIHVQPDDRVMAEFCFAYWYRCQFA